MLDPRTGEHFCFENVGEGISKLGELAGQKETADKETNWIAFYALQGCGPRINKFLFKINECTPKQHVFLLGSKLISLLEAIHAQGYVYNNLQFENIVVAKNGVKPVKNFDCFRDESLFLLECGLATPYIDFETGKHLKQAKVNSLSGEFLFASPDRLNFRSTSRRDDLISLCYLLLYLLNDQRMPWVDVP